MRRRSTSLVLITCLVLVTAPAAVAQEQADVARLLDELPDILEEEGVVVNGKNPGELEGRWLALVGADALKPYSAVYIGDVHSDMLWEDEEKEKPMDEHKLDQEIHERVLARLTKTGALGEVLHRGEPEPDAEGYLRLDCTLAVDPGHRGKRYISASGKSRSVLEIVLRDHRTGQRVALFHGYGIGTGLGFKAFGGGARKMTMDDIQENTKMFVELVKKAR